MKKMCEINTKLLAEVIESVHQAQMEQCFSLTIPQLSQAIAKVYELSIEKNGLLEKEQIVGQLNLAK